MLLLRHLQRRRRRPGRIRGHLSTRHKFTSSWEAAVPLLRLFPLHFFFGRNGFTDRQHDPHEQDCDVAGGIDGGRAILISSTTCIFTALSAQLVADGPFCGPTQRLVFLSTLHDDIHQTHSRRNGGKHFFTPLGPPFLRHLHRHDCIRQCFPKTRHEFLLHFSGQDGVHWHATTRWEEPGGGGGLHEGAAHDPAGWDAVWGGRGCASPNKTSAGMQKACFWCG